MSPPVSEKPNSEGPRRVGRSLARLAESAAPALWAALLVLVPISSFPLLTREEGGTVGPLAAVPAFLLLLVWVIPKLFQKEPLPPHSTPLFAFVGLATLTSAASLFLEFYPFLGQSVAGRSLRALTTLAIGLTFYLVAAIYPSTPERLRASMRWLAAGALPMLIWSTVQALLTLSQSPIPWQLQEFQRLFSVRDLVASRVSGFAYEPSWLADQLAVLYLPMWGGAILASYSAFKRVGRRFPVEGLLLAWGLAILVFTKSRIGLLAVLSVVAVLGLLGTWRLGAHVRAKRDPQSRALSVTVRMLLMVGVLGGLLGGVYLLGRFDPRLARIFVSKPAQIATGWPGFYQYANRLAYAERVMYWMSGLKAFTLHPLLGVGLGNSGFLFRESVPTYGYSLPEIIAILNGAPGFPNPKSLWVRLLAETGIVGLLLFSVWLVKLGLSAYALTRNRATVLGALGIAGLFALGVQVFEGLSLDSFALPQLWIVLGLVSAAVSISSETGPRALSEEGSA